MTIWTSAITPVQPIQAKQLFKHKKMKKTSEIFSLYNFWKSFVFSAELKVHFFLSKWPCIKKVALRNVSKILSFSQESQPDPIPNEEQHVQADDTDATPKYLGITKHKQLGISNHLMKKVWKGEKVQKGSINPNS